MRNSDKLQRSNFVLIGLVILFLLYGVIYRIQTGDNKLVIFGYTIELPFGQQEEAPSDGGAGETGAAGEAGEAGAEAVGGARLMESIEALIG